MNPVTESPPHKWRRDTSWWDDLEITLDVKEQYKDVFVWLSETAPDPTEHDFVLYTDGSGCDKGWGGYAAVIQRVTLNDEKQVREVSSTECLLHASYGSTVQRCELSAFLDGMHHILNTLVAEVVDQAELDPAEKFDIGQNGPLSKLLGPTRPTVLWYTDRSNLAKAMLFDERGDVLNARSSERDLWMRWSSMAQYCCVTPMCLPRNVIDGQALCDTLAGFGRELLKSNMEQLQKLTENFIKPEKWIQPKSQRIQF